MTMTMTMPMLRMLQHMGLGPFINDTLSDAPIQQGVQWTVGDHYRAYGEGWYVLFRMDGTKEILSTTTAPGQYESPFRTKEDAFVHVATRAAAGDDLCRRAIEIVTPYLKG
jgi:hypothetical protein